MKNKFVAGLLFLFFSMLAIFAMIVVQKTPSNSIDTSFNTNRNTISANLTSDVVIPDHVANFIRQGAGLLTGSPRSGQALYIAGGQSIMLSVAEITNQNFQDVWNGNFLTVSCGDVQGQVKTHQSGAIPYRYATCNGLDFSYYEFRWFNKGWILTAYITSTSGVLDPKNLLEFVNSYPY